MLSGPIGMGAILTKAQRTLSRVIAQLIAQYPPHTPLCCVNLNTTFKRYEHTHPKTRSHLPLLLEQGPLLVHHRQSWWRECPQATREARMTQVKHIYKAHALWSHGEYFVGVGNLDIQRYAHSSISQVWALWPWLPLPLCCLWEEPVRGEHASNMLARLHCRFPPLSSINSFLLPIANSKYRAAKREAGSL